MIPTPATPDVPRRDFSPDVAEALINAMRAFDESDAADATLRAALLAAGRNARERALTPEELIVALKAARKQAGVGRRHNVDWLEHFYTITLRALLTAYYAPDTESDGPR